MTLAHLSSRRLFHRSMLVLVVSFAGVLASGGASANTLFDVSATCSGGGQLCNNIATFQHTIMLGGPGQAKFTPGSLTCSNFRVHILVDGTEVAVTSFVGAGGNTGFVDIGVISAGPHTFGVQAEGQVSGCNVGTLLSWAGKVRLQPAP